MKGMPFSFKYQNRSIKKSLIVEGI